MLKRQPMRFNDGTAGHTDQLPAGRQKAAGVGSVDWLVPPVVQRIVSVPRMSVRHRSKPHVEPG